MSFRAYSAVYVARFAELAELLHECRAAFRSTATDSQWLPNPTSAAARDISKLSEHDPPYPQGTALKITSVLYFYMHAASEYLGALGALYVGHEVLIPNATLVRCSLEHCAVSAWLLQRGDGPLEDRLARAYLEEIASAEEAKKTSGRLLGQDDPEHRRQAKEVKMLRDEAATVFGESPMDDDGKLSIRGQRRLGPTETVAWLLGFMGQPQDRTAALGVYDYLSNLSHPTLYPHIQMWTREDQAEEARSSMSLEDHEKMIRLAVVPYYETLSYVMSYHGWPAEPQQRLTEAMEHTLPGVFVDSAKI